MNGDGIVGRKLAGLGLLAALLGSLWLVAPAGPADAATKVARGKRLTKEERRQRLKDEDRESAAPAPRATPRPVVMPKHKAAPTAAQTRARATKIARQVAAAIDNDCEKSTTTTVVRPPLAVETDPKKRIKSLEARLEAIRDYEASLKNRQKDCEKLGRLEAELREKEREVAEAEAELIRQIGDQLPRWEPGFPARGFRNGGSALRAHREPFTQIHWNGRSVPYRPSMSDGALMDYAAPQVLY